MTSEQLSQVSVTCHRGNGEYKRVMGYIGLEGQLKVYSLGQVKIEGWHHIYAMCKNVEKILGFQDGDVRYRFKPNLGSKGTAYPWDMIVELGTYTNLETIVHELTHIMCDKDTTVWASQKMSQEGGIRKRNTSVHNRAFSEWLVACMDNVLEHSEELGIRVYSAEDVLIEGC